MARKRKTVVVPPCSVGEQQIFDTGLYGRLSVLDNGKVEGDSLESQIELMEQYVSARPYLRYVKLYQDNGFTGTNFTRPGWEELLRDVAAGKINCIIVKDLSRLGRNYIETGEFLEKECPRLGVRFISINDGYDSADLNATEELTAALKNIINDYYAKDISRKASSALEVKRKRGDYIGSYAPYGYQKDPSNKNHLIVDPATAPVVLQIFQWRVAGDGYSTITRKLNEADIPSPGRYRFEQGIITNNNKKGTGLLWNRHALTDILRNPAYIGHLAQGKCRASLYQGIPAHTVGRDEWDIAYNTHEAILPEGLFRAVQRLNEEKAAAYHKNYGKYSHLPKEINPYGKKLVCADCGSPLKLYRALARGGDKAYYSYVCPVYEEHRELKCRKKAIRSFVLDQAVLAALRCQMDIFMAESAVLINRLIKSAGEQAQDSTLTQRRSLERQLERNNSLAAALYADWKSGILTRDEYIFAKEQYGKAADTLKRQICELEAVMAEPKTALGRIKAWQKEIAQYYGAEQVTKELVDAFIVSIRLGHDNEISVTFSFEKDYQQVARELKRREREVA